MRDEKAIRADIAAAQAEYEAAAKATPEPVWRPLHERVKGLQRELVACLTQGAIPCSRCGGEPTGLRHVRGEVRKGGVARYRHAYEVGCPVCVDTPDDDRRGVHETQLRPSGAELEQFSAAARDAAVAEWNQRNAKS